VARVQTLFITQHEKTTRKNMGEKMHLNALYLSTLIRTPLSGALGVKGLSNYSMMWSTVGQRKYF